MALDDMLTSSLLHPGAQPSLTRPPAFTLSLSGLLAGVVALLSVICTYPEGNSGTQVDVYYMWYIHVAIMILLGFGFLMTFLRSYSYSSVALNFLCSAVVMLEALVFIGYAQQKLGVWNPKQLFLHKIEMDLPLLIDAAFAAGAAMISFGAVLGKTTPTQTVWLLAAQVPVYAANCAVMNKLGVLDVGGSMSIHAFGAYYGLAASLSLSPLGSGSTHPKNGASYSSDVTAMIGTLFLWIFWPSFNGALADGGAARFACVMNTVLALLGAAVSAFAASAFFENGKLSMVHVQNATLAGGVAMGSAASLSMPPGLAVALGAVAGVLSTAGYVHGQKRVETIAGVTDTCGVHYLHGLPGILGGTFSAAAIALLYDANKAQLDALGGLKQPIMQLVGLTITLAMAIVFGGAVGKLVAWAGGSGMPASALPVDEMYEDGKFWTEVEDEDGILSPTDVLA